MRFAVEPFTYIELLSEVLDVVWSRGRAGARRRRCVGNGGVVAEHQGTHALLWVAAARTTVVRRGLAVRAGDDGRAGAGGSNALQLRRSGRDATHTGWLEEHEGEAGWD